MLIHAARIQIPFKPKPNAVPSRRFFQLLPAAFLPTACKIGRFFFVKRRYKSVSVHMPIKLRYMAAVTAASVSVIKGKIPRSIPRNCPSMISSAERKYNTRMLSDSDFFIDSFMGFIANFLFSYSVIFKIASIIPRGVQKCKTSKSKNCGRRNSSAYRLHCYER